MAVGAETLTPLNHRFRMQLFASPRRIAIAGCLLAFFGAPSSAPAAAEARLRVLANERAPFPIPRLINGKFTEHLFNNVYHGIDAQVLRNSTFSDYPFWTGQTTPDGVATFQWEREKINSQIRREAPRLGWPAASLAQLIEDYHDGLAGWWTRLGDREDVLVSPDTARHGQRAQRLEIRKAGAGIAQWTYLPAHRATTYEYAIYLRSPDVKRVRLALTGEDAKRWDCRNGDHDSQRLAGVPWSPESPAGCAGGRPLPVLNHRKCAWPTRHRPRVPASGRSRKWS